MKFLFLLVVSLWVAGPAAADANWYSEPADAGPVLQFNQLGPGGRAIFYHTGVPVAESAVLDVGACKSCDATVYKSAAGSGILELFTIDHKSTENTQRILSTAGDVPLTGDVATLGAIGIFKITHDFLFVDVTSGPGAGEWIQVVVECEARE